MHDQGGTAYFLLRFLHIVGSMVFLGALVLAVALKLHADRARDAASAAALHRGLARADALVIAPAAIATFVGGYSMIRFLGGRIAQHWFAVWGLILLFLSLAFWYFGVRRLNARIARDADLAARGGQTLGHDYAKASAMWLLNAALAVLALVAAAVVMVFRAQLGIA